jgi:hypothetical protein
MDTSKETEVWKERLICDYELIDAKEMRGTK